MRTVWMMLFVLMISCQIYSEEPIVELKEGPDKVESGISNIEEIPGVANVREKYATTMRDIILVYCQALNSEREHIFSKGDFDLVKAIEAERESVSKICDGQSTADWKKDKYLASAQKTLNNALAANRNNYIDSLNKVVSDLVKQRKMKEAERVRKVVDDMKLEEVKRVIVGTWEGLDKNKKNPITFLFKEDMTFSINNGEVNGTWKYNNKEIYLQFSNNSNVILIKVDGNNIIFTEGIHKGGIGTKRK